MRRQGFARTPPPHPRNRSFSDLTDYRDGLGRLEFAQMKLINEKLAQIFGHFIAHVLMDSLIQRAERIAPRFN